MPAVFRSLAFLVSKNGCPLLYWCPLLYYRPLLRHLDEFPNDSLIGNNTAWLAASCNRHLEKAKSIASQVVVSHPDATYLDTLAEIEYRLGNVESATALSTRCLQMEPKNKQHRKQLKRFRAGNP